MEGNRAVRIHGKNDLRVETLDIPEPPENFVQLRMSTVGLCRTDVHLFEEGRVDHIIINKPITIGHEISGTVSKLGPGVTDLAVGDRVAIDPCRPCGVCHQCMRKRSNICQNMDISGVLHVDGGFANYMITPSYTCYKLPDNVTLEEGAMMEPLSVGVNAVHRAQMNPGDSVIVFGAVPLVMTKTNQLIWIFQSSAGVFCHFNKGPVGLFAMQSAKALGAGKVMMVDINENRLSLAKKLGADIIYRPPGPMVDPQLAGDQLKEALGDDADLCIECSGAKGTVDAAIHACRPGSKVVMVGFGDMAMNVHLGMAAVREIDLIGAFANVNDYPECIRLVSSGKIDVKSAITHRLPLDKVKDGMELIKTGQSVKVVIDCTR